MSASSCGFDSHLAHKDFKIKKYNYSHLAYVIGLVTTDGSLSKDGRHIAFRSSDYQLIKTFRSCLGLKNVISRSKSYHYQWSVKPSYIIQFGDVHFYHFLNEIGLTPAKTHTIGALRIPDNYFPDFLRGHLDGDGTITSYQDTRGSYRGRNYTNFRLSLRFLSASQEHIRWLQSEVKRLSGCVGAVFDRPPRHENGVPMWTIKYSKKESVRLIEWMYYAASLPCLERKFLKVQEARINLASQKRKIYCKI